MKCDIGSIDNNVNLYKFYYKGEILDLTNLYLFLKEELKKESVDKNQLRLYYLGKKGLIPEALKGLGSLSIEEKKSKGQELNIIKKLIEETVKDQKIISEGSNKVTSTNAPTAHGEIVAIREACKKVNNFSLSGFELYS